MLLTPKAKTKIENASMFPNFYEAVPLGHLSADAIKLLKQLLSGELYKVCSYTL